MVTNIVNIQFELWLLIIMAELTGLTEMMPQVIEVGEEYRIWLEKVPLAQAKFINKLKSVIDLNKKYQPFRTVNKTGIKNEDNTEVYSADTYLIGFYYQLGDQFEWVWSWKNDKLKDLGLPSLEKAITESEELSKYDDELIFEDLKFVDFLVAVANHYGDFEYIEIKKNELDHTIVVGWKNIKFN